MWPKILITLDTSEVSRKGIQLPVVQTKQAYGAAVEKAGGVPLYVAPTENEALLESLTKHMDGLLVTGGHFDIPPELFGQTKQKDVRLDQLKPVRTNFESYLIRYASTHAVPILGICGGMQLIGAMTGSRIYQDINAEVPSAIDHEQPSSPLLADHEVILCQESPLGAALGDYSIQVNSTHHQALATTSEDFLVEGVSPDGITEMIRKKSEDHYVLGVQWHPELLDDRVSDNIYKEFIQAAKTAKRVKTL
ncbi:MAG: gamma-glutamyl-gamma-aminobutyrate hydrolase family protein [Myxococcota bacterium]|nr:gamma-glutamyl-gamma-aminobutyrate hydrolase family protein [Myxococcota bacterium]